MSTPIRSIAGGRTICVWLKVAASVGALAIASFSHGESFSDATAASQAGNLVLAASLYKQASEEAQTDMEQLQALWGLADVYRHIGKNNAALETLTRASAMSTTPRYAAATAVRLGGVYFALGMYGDAHQTLSQVEHSKSLLVADERVALLLDQGNVQIELGTYAEAVEYYSQAVTSAAEAGRADLEARARLNVLRAKLDGKDLGQLDVLVAQVEPIINKVTAAHQRREFFLALGDVYRRGMSEFGYPRSWGRNAYNAIRRAMDGAQTPAELGYVNGFMGRLYEDFEEYDDALMLTRQAVFHAQQAGAGEQIYRWEWQMGRLLRAIGDLAGAQDAYQRAVYELNEVRSNFALGSRRTFEQLVSPVYTQYADVMLLNTGGVESSEVQQLRLSGVRNLLEDLKAAEVEDYFASDCVAKIQAQDAASVTDASAAVIYPVFLNERTEILVEAGGELQQFTTKVGRNQITQIIRRLRVNLERSTSGEGFMGPAQQLYDWLIAPTEDFLKQHNVHTLVVVPEGALRTVPISALHDGEQFLVQRFAVATTPAIQLTKQLQVSESDSMLVGGLTESVQGFVGLPNVEREIDRISKMYPGKTIQDDSFQLKTVESELQAGGYSVAHFATHGEFSSDHKKSFILTYDDKLTLNGLQHVLDNRDKSEPLDLLVLSACKTAAGDDRAALGLAGVAVQSGAQSALASLWYISDAATAELIEKFYTALSLSNNSKAESLRMAQLALLDDVRFQHPSYWAPYLLVGNWL